MSESPEPINLFFRLTSLAGAAFALTVLAMFAAMFSPPSSPLAEFLNRHGMTLIVVEVLATGLLAVTAMTIDRRRTLRSKYTDKPDPD